VLFIHGAFEDRTYFAPQVTRLAQRWRVVALDLRGHGESDTQETVSIADFAEDVVGVARAADVDGAILCGHSMGGHVALAVAAARPELVRGVVMLDGTVLLPEAIRRQGLENLPPALETDRWLDALRGYFRRTFDPSDPPELTARVLADLGRTRPEFRTVLPSQPLRLRLRRAS
jgi:pimeloyl-ACP methyl ester carboxylesterase